MMFAALISADPTGHSARHIRMFVRNVTPFFAILAVWALLMMFMRRN
jgi:hypothetical protein